MRRSLFIWIALLAFLLAPLMLWFEVVGNVSHYFAPEVPDGQFLYVLSKLFGLMGITFVGSQLILILGRAFSTTLRFHWPVSSHRLLGGLALCCVAIHVGLFVVAASLRSSHIVWSLFKFRWFDGYYDAMMPWCH